MSSLPGFLDGLIIILMQNILWINLINLWIRTVHRRHEVVLTWSSAIVWVVSQNPVAEMCGQSVLRLLITWIYRWKMCLILHIQRLIHSFKFLDSVRMNFNFFLTFSLFLYFYFITLWILPRISGNQQIWIPAISGYFWYYELFFRFTYSVFWIKKLFKVILFQVLNHFLNWWSILWCQIFTQSLFELSQLLFELDIVGV